MKVRYSQFKDAIDIDAFESAIGFSPTHQNGDWDQGYCLFPENHRSGDSTGKFGINRSQKYYHCWLCGSGSLLSLAMELYGWDSETATDWLYQFATGDTRDDGEFHEYILSIIEDTKDRIVTMPYFNDRALDRFDGPTDYFLERGIDSQTIEAYHLCYAEDCLKPAPMKQKGSEKVKIDDDYHGPAAIFPHYWQGRLVGWQHRWMEWDKDHSQTPIWLSKYTNTTDFPKSNTLFNYDNILKAKDPIVVVESVPTALFLQSYGVPAVAYFGDSPKPEQLRLLRRFQQGVILAPDNDANGERLVREATEYLESYIPVWHCAKVVTKPGADLNDVSFEVALAMLEAARPSFDVLSYI